jgi:AmpE protein
MKFIVLLFTVLLQKQTKQQGYKRKRTWFSRLSSFFKANEKGLSGQVVAFACLVIVPGLVVGLFIDSLNGLLGNLLALLLQVVLLLYILGRDDFSQRFEAYKACWARADYQGAFECASGFLGIKDSEHAKNPCQLHQAVSKAVIYAWFLRFFVFIFWYLAVGVGGAFATLLSYWFYREFKYEWAKSVVGAIEWLPSRLLALTTALAGDFTHSFPQALKFMLDFQTPANEVLSKTVFPELTPEDKFDCDSADDLLQETNQLMFRSAVIWLLLVAVLTVFAGF